MTWLLCVALLLPPPVPAQQPGEPGMAAFHAAVERYLELHRRLKSEVPVLNVTADPGEITRASDTLAAALQRARRAASRGEFFNPDATRVIVGRVRTALEGVDVRRFIIAINDEPKLTSPPRMHMRYPTATAMATMPTRVLDVLPALPPELEYRLIGRALILRDRDAALIIDYIADVLPPAR